MRTSREKLRNLAEKVPEGLRDSSPKVQWTPLEDALGIGGYLSKGISKGVHWTFGAV